MHRNLPIALSLHLLPLERRWVGDCRAPADPVEAESSLLDDMMTAASDLLVATCPKTLGHDVKLQLQLHLEVPAGSDEAAERDILYWQQAFEAPADFVAVPIYAHLPVRYPELVVQVAC